MYAILSTQTRVQLPKRTDQPQRCTNVVPPLGFIVYSQYTLTTNNNTVDPLLPKGVLMALDLSDSPRECREVLDGALPVTVMGEERGGRDGDTV